MAGGGPGFYGSEHAPFVIEADPAQPDFEVQDLRPLEGSAPTRQERRRTAAGRGREAGAGRRRQGRPRRWPPTTSKAHDLITSPEARKAFDIRAEPETLREAYGYTVARPVRPARAPAGRGGLPVRRRRSQRLGPPLHDLPQPGKGHAPRTSIGPSAPWSTDLDQRGLLDSTLVVMMGEMGRTPRVNTQAGRDHWSMAQSVLFAGGGVKPGQVIGATDKQAACPTDRPGQRRGHPAHDLPPDGRRHHEDLLHAAGPAGADRRRRPGDPGPGVIASCRSRARS